MITELVKEWEIKKSDIRGELSKRHPRDYKELVKIVVNALSDAEISSCNKLDPDRIHEIDDGDYQGTLVYVIGAKGYQPSTYWSVLVYYGSCSGCDTLQSIAGYSGGQPNKDQVDQYMTLALHIVQGMNRLGEAV